MGKKRAGREEGGEEKPLQAWRHGVVQRKAVRNCTHADSRKFEGISRTEALAAGGRVYILVAE